MFCLFCFLLTNTTSPDNFHKSVNIAHSLSSTSTSSISPLSHDSSLLNNQNDPTIYNPSILKSRLSSCDLNTKPRPFIKKMSVTDVRVTVPKECLVTFKILMRMKIEELKIKVLLLSELFLSVFPRTLK